MKPAITALTQEDLRAMFAELGEPKYRVDQILQWLYKKRVETFEEMTNLPAALREKLAERFTLALPEFVRKTGSADTTQKFLFSLADGSLIETVLIPATIGEDGKRARRRTLCVSSQVGCAYGCKFCASGLDGWKRHLTPDEIVGQLLVVEKITGETVQNLVFMGMGEPFANYDNLMRAITILNAPWGLEVGARHITVSTSGLAPQIRQFAEQPLQLRLAISLHGATDEVREQIMPINRKYPLEDLFAACACYQERKKQKISFEYILIAGVNDSSEQARALAERVRGFDAKINLIPYNTVTGLDWERPEVSRQKVFLQILQQLGVPATIRREKGHDIDAACGQLRLRQKKDVAGSAISV